MVRISANTSKPSNVHPRFEAISAFHCVRVSERYHGECPKMADSLMVPSLRCVWAPVWRSRRELTPISVPLGTRCQPSVRREVVPCQLWAVHTWHLAKSARGRATRRQQQRASMPAERRRACRRTTVVRCLFVGEGIADDLRLIPWASNNLQALRQTFTEIAARH